MNWEQKTIDSPKLLHYSAALDAGSRGYHYFKDPQLRGHALRVYATGRRSFVVRSTVNGRMREHALGNAMKDGGMSLKAAREEAQVWLAQLRKGVDPQVQVIKEASKVELVATSLQQALIYYRDHQNVSDGTKRVLTNAIEFHLDDWLQKPLLEIDRPMVRARYQKILSGVKAGGALRNGEIANKVMRNLSAVWNVWTFDHDAKLRAQGITVPTNPAKARPGDRVQPKKVIRYVVPVEQLPVLLGALPRVAKTTALLFRLLLRTGLRVGAAMSLKREYIKSDRIEIPGDVDRGKVRMADRNADDPHQVIPLTPGIKKILKEADAWRDQQVKKRQVPAERAAVYVFPSRRAESGHVENQQYFFAELAQASGVQLTAHSVRRLFATLANRVPGITFAELQALLNHSDARKGSGVTEGYVAVELDRRRELLAALERSLPSARAKP
jgi:integrase